MSLPGDSSSSDTSSSSQGGDEGEMGPDDSLQFVIACDESAVSVFVFSPVCLVDFQDPAFSQPER